MLDHVNEKHRAESIAKQAGGYGMQHNCEKIYIFNFTQYDAPTADYQVAHIQTQYNNEVIVVNVVLDQDFNFVKCW